MASVRERREAIIRRLGGQCKQCGSTLMLELDHIEPGRFGRAIYWHRVKSWANEENLQVLCKPCHIVKSKEDMKRM